MFFRRLTINVGFLKYNFSMTNTKRKFLKKVYFDGPIENLDIFKNIFKKKLENVDF